MVSKDDRKEWETFVRRPSELGEGKEVPLVIRDLSPGKKKYRMRHVVGTLSRKPEQMSRMDRLYVRTVVGVLLPEPWGISIVRELPIEVSGKPYRDFYQALKAVSSASES
jgi:hypothetical protein